MTASSKVVEFDILVKALNKIIFGSEIETVTLNGIVKPTISNFLNSYAVLKADVSYVDTKIANVNTAIAAIAGGHKAYTTLALAQAAQSSLPANTAIEVTNDGANNGTYQWNGTTLTKSAYDPLTRAKMYTDEKNNENNPNLLGVVLTGLTVKTLDASEAKYKILFLSGTLGGDCVINFPKQRGIWEVRHQATGGAILLKTLDSALTPVRILNGQLVTVLSDGTNLLATNGHKVNANGGILTEATANTPSATSTLGVANVQFSNRLSHGATYISLTADKVLSADEASYKSIIFIGALNSDTIVEFPVGTGQWVVSNGTTGGFKLSLKCTGQASTPITLADNGYYNISAAGSTIRFTETLNQTKTASISLTGLSEKTLSVEEARNDVIFLGGTLTQPITVNFPKRKGVWNVRHQGTAGFSIHLKTLDSTAVSPIPITNGQMVTVVSDAINLHIIGMQNQTGEHRGSFKVRQTYNMNDIVEHGSGTYKVVASVSTNATTPLNNTAYKRIGSKPINNKELLVKSTNIIPLTDKIAPMWISRDGLTCWANSPFRKLMESKDYGETWYELFDVGHGAVGFVDQLDNGELIFIFTESSAVLPLVRQLYMTKGYGTETVTFESVLTTDRKYNYFSGFWGYNNYKHIILLTEYGCKYKSDAPSGDPSWTNEVGGNARYVYMSTDYGKTWKIIFDLNSKTNGIGVHMHSAVYDHVWNRIWVHHGDGAFGKNGMYYSDDMGDTWTWALETNSQGVNFTQATCTVVLEDCILFGSDSSPNGVYRLDRSQGKTPIAGHYKLEVAFKIPDTSDTLLNAVCYKAVQTQFIPNMPYLFGFAPESNPSKGIIVGTFDGYNFFNVWQDDTTRAVGDGIRQLIGVTPKNEIIAVLRDGSGTDKEIRIKV